MQREQVQLQKNLQTLMGISLALHVIAALLLSPGYYLFSTVMGLSSGYLAIASSVVVRNRLATRQMYVAVIATWAFWCVLSLWKNSMLSRIDALISTFFTIVIYCEFCLGMAFYSKWQFTKKALQFPLIQVFVLTAILAVVSFLWSSFPDSAPHVVRSLGTIISAVAGCFLLPLVARFRIFGAVMFGCLIVVVGIYGCLLPLSGFTTGSLMISNSELLVTSISQWLIVTFGGALLLQIERDEEVSDSFNSAATKNQLPSEIAPDPLDEL